MKKQDILSLLNDPDKITELFYDYELHASDSFFIIDPITKEYDTNWGKNFSSFLFKMDIVLQSYREGKTIVIKNLEKFINEDEEFGKGVDIHAYIVPRTLDNTGDSFGWHTDDRDVHVKILWGKKRFEFEENIKFELTAGQTITFGRGCVHRAVPLGPSCLLSIGFPNPEDV